MAATAGRMNLLVAAGAVMAMFLWSLCFPLINFGLDAAPPMTYATLRAVVSGASLLLLATLLRRPPLARDLRSLAGVAAIGLSATALGFTGMFNGGGLVSPGIATVIANVQPLLAAVLAWLLLGERLGRAQQLGLAAGFGGMVLIGLPDLVGGGGVAGMAYLLVGAAGVAVGNVLQKRLAGQLDVIRAMGWQFLVGALPLGLFAFASEDVTTVRWDWTFIWSLMVLSLLGTAAVFVLWFHLLGRARLTQLNVFTFLTPMFGLLIGRLFFGERITPIAVGGISLSLVGIYLVSRAPLRR